MKITVTRAWKDPVTQSIEDFVSHEISHASAWVEGRQEQNEAEQTHLAKSFSILVETLASKGFLTAPEVVRIATHYDADNSATFTR